MSVSSDADLGTAGMPVLLRLREMHATVLGITMQAAAACVFAVECGWMAHGACLCAVVGTDSGAAVCGQVWHGEVCRRCSFVYCVGVAAWHAELTV